MSTIQEEARAKLGLDISEWEAKLRGAQAATDSFFRRISTIATLGMGSFGLSEFKQFIDGVMNRSRDLKNVSSNIGASVETIQGWARMMRKAGWDTEFATDKLGKLSEQLGGARSGDKSALQKFKAVGIDLESAKWKAASLETVLRGLINYISNEGDKQIRGSRFEDLFGRSTSEGAFAAAQGLGEFERNVRHWGNLTTEQNEQVAMGRAIWRGLWQDIIDGAAKATASLMNWDSIVKNTKNIPSPYSRFITSKSVPEVYGPPIPAGQRPPSDDDLKKSNDLDNKLSEARDKRLKANEDALKTEKRLFKEAEYLDRLSMNFDETSNTWKELQIDRENKLAEAEKLSIERQAKNVELRKQKTDAEQALYKSAEDLAYRQTDRWHFTLEDVAGWKGGNRWRQQSGMRARAVQQLEAASRNQASMGYGWNADALMQRADYLRGTISALKSDERAPFADAAQSLNEISAKLDVLEQKLTPARK